MDFFDVVRARQSIRKFNHRQVEPAKLTQILETLNQAPSAGNLQAYRVFVVRHPQLRVKLAQTTGTNQAYVADAPVVLVFCAEPQRSAERYGSRGADLYCVQDTTIACAYAQLAATALGLSSVWIGSVFEPEVIKEVLNLTTDLWPLIVLPIGYPAETPPRKPRRPLSELIGEV